MAGSLGNPSSPHDVHMTHTHTKTVQCQPTMPHSGAVVVRVEQNRLSVLAAVMVVVPWSQ